MPRKPLLDATVLQAALQGLERQLCLSQVLNCMRTWELWVFRRFSPGLVLKAFLASFLASFRGRAALQVGSPVSSSRGSSLASRCGRPHAPALPTRRYRNGPNVRRLGGG